MRNPVILGNRLVDSSRFNAQQRWRAVADARSDLTAAAGKRKYDTRRRYRTKHQHGGEVIA